METTSSSSELIVVMKPLEDRRARIEAYRRQKAADKSLTISETSDTISFEGKGEGKGKGKTTSTKEEKGGGAVAVAASSSVPTTPVWERYIDELQQDEQWKEVDGFRSFALLRMTQ